MPNSNEQPISERNDQSLKQTNEDPSSTKQSKTVEKSKKHTFDIGRVPDFGRNHESDDNKIMDTTNSCQPYTNQTLTQKEGIEQYIEHNCILHATVDMTRHNKLFHSIPLYVERDVNVTEIMLNQAKQFAWIIFNLAKDVFEIPTTSLHLFRDINGNAIAYNLGGSLFFNLRYYEQVYAEKLDTYLQNPTISNDIIYNIVNFYYMVTCHELAHNIESDHNQKFVAALKTLAIKFMNKRVLFIEQFSFDNALRD